MKSSVLRSLFLLPLIVYAEACSGADKSQSMNDPLLGLPYNPDSVRFEPCPSWFDTREGHISGKEWIFAKCPLQEGTYYIYSGLFKQWNDQKEIWVDSILEPDFGATILVQGQKVTDIGTPDILYGKKQKLPAKTIQCLAEDAVKRYLDAFGGIPGLQKAVAERKITSESLPRALVEALRASGISIPDRKRQ